MKKTLLFSLTLFSLANAQTDYDYVSPKPGAILVTNQTNIILRHADQLDAATISDDLIKVVGAKSGLHKGELVLSADGQTVVFNPHTAFSEDEDVTVQIRNGMKTQTGVGINDFSFHFETAPGGIVQRYVPAFSGYTTADVIPETQKKLAQSELLPAPPITVHSVNNPSPGHIFMTAWDRNNPHVYGNFLFILDHRGTIVDSVRVDGAPFDFRVQPNGLLSYSKGDFAGNVPGAGEEQRQIVLDNTLAVVDSFKTGNGYNTDFHEFRMLPNGNAMLMSYHPVTYDMSKLIEGGKVDASLILNVIQEQDRDKNVVFEWRNIDHLPITDTVIDLTLPRINYATLNAFSIDDDGNILTSFRNMGELMKINRATGEVMWRMGSPRGEFTFIGENEENAPYYFSHQHHIVRLPNGNVSFFDNGNFHSPPYSRAVEYALDEDNKTATLVSEWRYPGEDIFAAFAGNAQRLQDGGWLIGYGILSPQSPVKRNVVETHADGTIALEISLPENVISYRTYKFPWKDSVVRASVSHFDLFEGNSYSFDDEFNRTGVTVHYTALSSGTYNEATVTRVPLAPLEPEFLESPPTMYPVSIVYSGSAITSHIVEVRLDLGAYPEIKHPATSSLYWREFPGNGLFLPVETAYDSGTNELIATVNGFGELAVGNTGNEYGANPPILFEPLDNDRLLLEDSTPLRWSGRGSADAFQIQVSTDSEFNTLLVDFQIRQSIFDVEELANNTRYYWRVRAMVGAEESAWSPVWSFETTDPFIDLTFPSAVEGLFFLGSVRVLRWETNILDTVTIDLFADGQHAMAIGEIAGNIEAFAWEIPADLSTSSAYTIQITSLADAGLSVSSQGFSLIDSDMTAITESGDALPYKFSLRQNYPNPFNSETVIAFEVPRDSYVTLKVYSLSGATVAAPIQRHMSAGQHQVSFSGEGLASGVYVYSLESGDFGQVNKMLLLK